MARNYSNTTVETTLVNAVGSSDTLVRVNDTTGMPITFPFSLILDYQGSNVEVVTVTGLSGPDFTVTRGEDGTGAQAHDAGAVVVHGGTARDFFEPQQHIDATSAHGVGGTADVVGTDTTQTLTNKTIDGTANTLANVTATAVSGVNLDDLADVSAAAPADTQVLTFDSGTSSWVAGLGGFQFTRKTAGTSRASDTTLSDDPHLTVSLAANAVYVFRVVAGVEGNDNDGSTFDEPNLKCSFEAPTGASMRWSYIGYDEGGNARPVPTGPTTFPNNNGATNLLIHDRANNSIATLTSYSVVLEGLVRTGGTAGTLAFRWAQFESSTIATVVYEDSLMLVQRVG